MEIVIIYPVLTKKVTNIDQKCQNYNSVYNSICRPHISVGVRVNSSSGLIFYVAGGKGQRTMTLSVFDGHLMLMVNGGKRKTNLRSKKKYNDGLWHTVRMWMSHDFRHTIVIVFSYFVNELMQVFVRVEADRASLTVDGLDTQNKRVTGGGKSVFGAPLYIGGLPSDHSAAMVNTITHIMLNTRELPCCLLLNEMLYMGNSSTSHTNIAKRTRGRY